MPAKAKLTTRERTTSNVTSDNLNKGSELSFAEADSNFINLRDQTIAISDGSTTTDIEAGETITFSGASVSGNTVSITGGGDIGNLQVNDTRLEPITTNDDLILDANGTGAVIVDSSNFYVNQPGDSGSQLGSRMRITPFDGVEISHEGRFSGDVFTVYGSQGQDAAYRIPFEVKAGNFASGGSPSNTDGQVYINEIKFPTGPGSNGQYLQTNGTDEYSWATIPAIPSIGDITFTGSTVSAPSNANLTLQPGGTGNIVLDGLNWPTADGSAGEFLKTDGAGNLSFDTPAISSFGDLTASGSTITAPTDQTMVLDVSGSGLIQLNNLEINDTTITTVFTNENVRLETKGTGLIDYDSTTHRFGTGSGDATITTNSTFDIIISTNQGTNSGFIKINQGSSGAIELSPSTSGKVVIDGLDWPTADGTNGQVLQTNGSGVLTFGDGTGGQHTITSPTATTSTLTADRSDGLVQFCDVSSLVTNLAIAQPSNMSAGDQLILVLKGNRAGSHNLSWNGIYNAYGTGTFGLTNTSIQVLRIVYDGTNYTSVTSGNLTAGN
jgi:hypothetical protein